MRGKTAVSLVVLAIAGAIFCGSIANASSSQESDFTARINAERTSRGIRALSVRSDLASVARRWSAEMASAAAISHDPNLASEVSGWTVLGDNVGRGGDVASLHQAFMNSPHHRANILDPSYNQVGVGVVSSGGYIYATEVFAQRATARVSVVRRVVYQPAQRAQISYEVGAGDVVWAIDLDPSSVTVNVLEQMLALDAS